MILSLCALSFVAFSAPQEGLLERFEFYANGRLRWESTIDQPNGEDRHRGRVRLRAGARARVQPNLKAEARLSTTSHGNDANNAHWDFGDGDEGFDGIELVLDRFFLTWEATPSLQVLAGKLPHALQGPPLVSEFLWDADISPGGAAAIWRHDGETVDWDVRTALYVAVESGSMDDASLLAGQVNARIEPKDALELRASAALYAWDDLADAAATLDNQGNTGFDDDFRIVEGILALRSTEGPLGGWEAFGQALHNTEADDEESGLVLGARLGRAREKGQTDFTLAWFDLDADAVFSPVAQDDTPIAGTGLGQGMQGLVGGGSYVLSENSVLRIWVLVSDTDTADPWRVRIDLNFSLP